MVAVCLVGIEESCTVKVKLYTPTVPAAGVPVIAPVEAFRLSPVGRSSATDQVIGNELVVIVNGSGMGLTVIERGCVSDCDNVRRQAPATDLMPDCESLQSSSCCRRQLRRMEGTGTTDVGGGTDGAA